MPAFRSPIAAALAAVAIAVVALVAPLTGAPARAATVVKVALIVGPTGSGTAENRSRADAIAQQVVALGGTVAKAYSPNATYAKVRAAVAGASIIVYMGHGNGYPNPYGPTFRGDRLDGWGLNTTTTHGDADSWSDGSMVYCGEKALAGQLTTADGAAQQTYCKGAIAPAAGFVMVYVGACYTAGNNENGMPAAANSEARLHLAYYSRPVLTALHGSGYFAGQAAAVVPDLIQHPDRSYGDIWRDSLPTNLMGAYDLPHALVAGDREWLTRQSSGPYWYYAFAGNPGRTFRGGTATFTAPTGTADFGQPTIKARTPDASATGIATNARVAVTFSEPVTGATTHVTLWRGSTKLTVTASYDPSTSKVILTPAARLAHGTTYTVKVDANVKDASGNPFIATSYWFKTSP